MDNVQSSLDHEYRVNTNCVDYDLFHFPLTSDTRAPLHPVIVSKNKEVYTAKWKVTQQKNHQPVAMLFRTGMNNVVLARIFKVVNNIEQNCFTYLFV